MNLSTCIRAVAIVFAASVWMGSLTAAQPASGKLQRLSPAEVAKLQTSEHQRAIRARSPAELRSHLLYRAGKSGTFRHSPANFHARKETSIRKASLDTQTEDRWFAFDKAQHVTFSFLWTLGTQYVFVNKGRISEHHALPVSISSSAVVGVSKEYYDLRIGPTQYFSVKDLVADAFGILLATGVILL